MPHVHWYSVVVLRTLPFCVDVVVVRRRGNVVVTVVVGGGLVGGGRVYRSLPRRAVLVVVVDLRVAIGENVYRSVVMRASARGAASKKQSAAAPRQAAHTIVRNFMGGARDRQRGL